MSGESTSADPGRSSGSGATDSADAAGGDVVLCGRGIVKSHGGLLPFSSEHVVLDGVDVDVRAGEITGIVGANGSGKSTLLRILAGIDGPDGGSVERNGSVGWCPQESRLYDRLTVRETFQLFGTGHGLEDDTIERRTAELANRLEFTADFDTRIEDLSGGNRQKVNLGVSLVHEPDVLLLDEPYSGFDWETYLAFWGLTDDLIASGTGIAIISHLLRKRDRFDRVFELEGGVLQVADRDE